MAVNILVTIIISIVTLVNDIHLNPADPVYPPQLPWDGLYTESARIVISSFVMIVGILFLFPVM